RTASTTWAPDLSSSCVQTRKDPVAPWSGRVLSLPYRDRGSGSEHRSHPANLPAVPDAPQSILPGRPLLRPRLVPEQLGILPEALALEGFLGHAPLGSEPSDVGVVRGQHLVSNESGVLVQSSLRDVSGGEGHPGVQLHTLVLQLTLSVGEQSAEAAGHGPQRGVALDLPLTFRTTGPHVAAWGAQPQQCSDGAVLLTQYEDPVAEHLTLQMVGVEELPGLALAGLTRHQRPREAALGDPRVGPGQGGQQLSCSP